MKRCPECGRFMRAIYVAFPDSLFFASFKKVVDHYVCDHCHTILGGTQLVRD